MKYVTAIRDRAVDAFGQPFFVPSLGMAIRSFQDEVNNPESPMHRHSEDYDLYHLGMFDEDTGQFSNYSENGGGPRMIAVGKDSVRAV